MCECPDCGCPESLVIKVRVRVINGKARRFRRRECEHCGRRYTTREDVLPGELKPQ